MLDTRTLRRGLRVATAVSAVALGCAGWLLFGPLWAIAGLAAGYVCPLIIYGAGTALLSPSPVALISTGRPEDALRRLEREEASSRRMARLWPGQFQDVLAYNMIAKADALHALHRYAHALRSADEGVAIYQALASDKPAKYLSYLSRAIDTRSRALAGLGRQAEAIQAIETAIRMFRDLAAAEPGRYLPVIAAAQTCMAEWLADIELGTEALAAAREAADIYWHKVATTDLPAYAARAALLEGRLLCRESRYNEAVRPLARGWTLAASQQLRDVLGTAGPVMRTAYRHSPDDFRATWHAQTGSMPPDWLTAP
jgi:hypothetical protein